MSYNKPPTLFKHWKQERIAPKSSFLRKLEKKQAEAREAQQAIADEHAEKVLTLPSRGSRS